MNRCKEMQPQPAILSDSHEVSCLLFEND